MRSKYYNFAESKAVMKPSKKAPWTPMSFVSITCPHCNVLFVDIPEAYVKQCKAGECLKHLRVCNAYEGRVKEAPEKKRKYTNEDIVKLVSEVKDEMKADMKAMEKRICLRVAKETGLGEPEPESEEPLFEKLANRNVRSQLVNIERIGEDEQCNICLETKEIKALLKPCMHTTTCFDCWAAHRAQKQALGAEVKCPTCTLPVEQAFELKSAM